MNDMEQDNQITEQNLQPDLYGDAGKKKRKKPGFAAGVVVGIAAAAVILVGGTFGICKAGNYQMVIGSKGASKVKNTKLLDQDTVDKVDELTNYMDLYYYEDYDVQDVQDGLLEGVVSGLGDKYSAYYTAEEYKEQQLSTSGTYYGIGAALAQDKDTMQVTITKIYEGTPSEEAGLKKDDVIVSADGTDATSMELTDFVKLIRGEEGTTVHLEIYRPSTEETLEFDVERKNVELPSVSSQMLENNIGYIQISEFQSKTAEQFESALSSLKDQGAQSLIVDVRGNGGGLVDSVVAILDDILPEGTVVYTEDKYGNRQDYTSSGDTYLDMPIAVLVDQNSASASEIFAGAIKDYNYGTLIGTKTFGKGIVQTVFSLPEGDAIKITTAKYFTPDGNYIHGVGIEPDIELEYQFMGGENDEYSVDLDNQIQKAIEVLSKQ
mgnify:FL=1